MLAPIGVQSIVHEQGELAAARAAASQSLPFILSTAASHSLEEVADKRGVSLNTARSHLKHAFAKTETSRQSELVRLIFSGVGQIREA